MSRPSAGAACGGSLSPTLLPLRVIRGEPSLDDSDNFPSQPNVRVPTIDLAWGRMENTAGPWGYGPFSINVEPQSPTGDHRELSFEVQRDDVPLGSVIQELTRSAATMVTGASTDQANGEARVRAQFLATARARLEKFLERVVPTS